jgi:ENTS family enterobactin (siderophore) exporter
VGVFAVVPLIVMGLYGGSLVDAHDRRRVVIVTAVGMMIVAGGFAAFAWSEIGSVAVLYLLVAGQNGFYAVNSAARASIVPRLLPLHLLPAANALSGLAMGAGFTLGPLLAGVLVSEWGYGVAYSIEAALLVVAVTTLVTLPPLPPEGGSPPPGLASVLDGLRFLRSRPNLRMTFFLDLAAMVLAMPRVLFPAIGASVIGGGATTVGILSAGIAVGTFVAGLLSGPLGHVRRQGLAVVVSVVAWGSAITAFGLVIALAPGPGPDGSASWFLWPAVGLLALAGAADAVSAVFRQTILQAATPDAMRGRLQGVFIVVVAGGPRLGDLTLGTVAELSAEATAAIAGGLGCVVVALALALVQPGFRHYDARDPTP